MRGWILAVVVVAACKGGKPAPPKQALAVPKVTAPDVLATEPKVPPVLLIVDDTGTARLAAAATWADLDAQRLTFATHGGPASILDRYVHETFALGKSPVEVVKSWDKGGELNMEALEGERDLHDSTEDDPPPPPEGVDDPTDESGGTGTAMALDEGKMGKKDSDRAEGQYRMKRSEEDPQLARQRAVEAARAAGTLGKIGDGRGGGLPFGALEHLNEDGTPSRAAQVEGNVRLDGQLLRTMIVMAPTAKATTLIQVLDETSGAIAVSQGGKLRPLNLDFAIPYDYNSFGGLYRSGRWVEARVTTSGIEVEAVPDKPITVDNLDQLADAITRAQEARGTDDDAAIDVLVAPDVDVQRMIDVVVALDAAGALTIGLGGLPSPDELLRRGHRVSTMSIGQPNAQGDLDKALIRKAVKRNRSQIKACYDKALIDKPALAGTVQTQFFISPDGVVIMASASGVDPGVANCVADVVKGIVFPKPKGGGGVQVNYPFTFRP